MADIVETVRAAANHPANNHGPQEWLNEAADEIEKLRAALDKMKRSRDRYRQAWEAEKARAALGGSDEP